CHPFYARGSLGPSNASYGALSGVQPRQPVRRADVEPFSLMKRTAQAPRRDRTLQQRQQWKLPRHASLEELRPVHPDAGIGEAIGLPLHHELTVEPEVAARVMRRIGREEQPRVSVWMQCSRVAKIHVGPDIGIDDQKRPWPKERQRAMNDTAGLERYRTLLAVGDADAVVGAITQGGADLLAEPGKIDHDVPDS